jgi:hypothetical protein
MRDLTCSKCGGSDIDVYDFDQQTNINGQLGSIWECACLDCDYEFIAKLVVVEVDGEKVEQNKPKRRGSHQAQLDRGTPSLRAE